MNRHPMLPITYSSYDVDADYMQFYEVKFEEDFGPYKKGEVVDAFSILFSEALACTYDEDNKRTRIVPVKIVTAASCRW